MEALFIILAFVCGMAFPLAVMFSGARYIKNHPEIAIKFVTHKMMTAVKQGQKESLPK